MAKIKDKKNEFEYSEIGTLLQKMPIESSLTTIDLNEPLKYITNEQYLLNAFICGSIFGGMPVGYSIILGGLNSSGKSFICYTFAAAAQRQGYHVLYIDTEFSFNANICKFFKIDPSPDKFSLVSGNLIEDLENYLAEKIRDLKEIKKKTKENPKIVIFMDSLGQLISKKEQEDAIEGDTKVDMTRAKGINRIFRLITTDLGNLGITQFFTNHVYADIKNSFHVPVYKWPGGERMNYSASVLLFLKRKEDRDSGDSKDEMDAGYNKIIVKMEHKKDRFVKPKKMQLTIDFDRGLNRYEGLDYFLTPENYQDIGIGQGKIEIDKETGEEIFIPGNRNYYIKHLNKSLHKSQIFNSKVFTDEILKKLDVYIQNYFNFTSEQEKEEHLQELDDLVSSINEKENLTFNMEDLDVE